VFMGPEDEPALAPAREAAEPVRKGAKAVKAPEAFVPFTEDAVAAEAFVLFVDDDAAGDAGFVPFCDEDEVRADHVLPRTLPHAHSSLAQEPAAARAPALGSVMQPKAAAADRVLESEAEALRKNPLKNYPGQE
jgi:hypothetical protein